jgi:hypothetical protein
VPDVSRVLTAQPHPDDSEAGAGGVVAGGVGGGVGAGSVVAGGAGSVVAGGAGSVVAGGAGSVVAGGAGSVVAGGAAPSRQPICVHDEAPRDRQTWVKPPSRSSSSQRLASA